MIAVFDFDVMFVMHDELFDLYVVVLGWLVANAADARKRSPICSSFRSR